MTKDPEDYEDKYGNTPYDHYSWARSDYAMRNLDTRIEVWVIFYEDEFWSLYTDSLSPRSENI